MLAQSKNQSITSPLRFPTCSLTRFLSFIIPAILLLGSWLLPATRIYWNYIDEAVFWNLNQFAKNHLIIGLFLAVGNVKLTDVYGAVFMLSFLILAVRSCPKEEWQTRLVQFIFILGWFEIAIFLTKQVATPILESYGLGRHSPTVVHKNVFILSDLIPWLKVKYYSHFSFPADHASIPFQWAAFVWFFFGNRIGILAASSSLVFILPRLTSGAHWISDCIVGSISLILIILAIALSTPLGTASYRIIERMVLWFSKEKS